MSKGPTLAALALVVLWSTTAFAQPGAESPYPGTETPAPTTRPVPPQPPNLRLRPPVVQMTEEERDILLRGEISIGRYISGGIVSYALGFGLGQTVQGRWTETGWIYTLGDVTSLGLIISGIDRCFSSDREERCARMAAGFIGLIGFRIAQVVDAWVFPHIHNRRVRKLRDRYRLDPYAVPYRARFQLNSARGGGVTAGVGFSF